MRWRRPKLAHVIAVVFLTVACVFLFRGRVGRLAVGGLQAIRGRKTVGDRVGQFGQAVRARLAPDFKKAGVAYPPGNIILVGLKQERQLEVWVSDPPKLLKRYPVVKASGVLGPKLREGDRQVPEGIYRIESLNPNSMFHLSLRINYPNRFDREKGGLEGRVELGSDIMIHGENCSVGCLAMGNDAAEDLFVLAADTGIENIQVILSPVDFRVRGLPADMPKTPDWTGELYTLIRKKLLPLQ